MGYIHAARCPECHGRLLFETVGSYGDIFEISTKTSRPSNRRKQRVHYEHNGDDSMVYCLYCGKNFNWKQDSSGVLFIMLDEGAE